MAKKGGKIALALGLVTGAVTGILFAPGKGQDLRKKIATERKSGGSGAKAVGNDLRKMGEEIVDLMKEVVETDEVQGIFTKLKGETAKLTNIKAADLDEWVKKAHTKAEKLKALASEYAKHKRSEIEGKVKKQTTNVKKVENAAKKKVNKVENKVRKTVKKVKAKVRKTAAKVESQVAPKKKKATKKK